MTRRKAKSLEEISNVMVRSMTLDKLGILFTLNQFGMKHRNYFYRRGLHSQVIWLKNYRLIKPVKLTKKLYYKYDLTEKGKATVELFKRAFKNRDSRALRAIGIKPLTETNF